MSNEDFNIQDDESCNHDNICPCCVARESHVTTFISNLMEKYRSAGKLSIEDLLVVTNDFYTIVQKQGSQEALEDIIGYAAHQIHGEEEDEDDSPRGG
jgi:hypothetical protein